MTGHGTVDRLLQAVSSQPRFPLAQLPTPLDEAPRLSERIGVRVLIKRDDQTGLALGGNKARKLEFLIADALRSGADTVVTTGGSQSNHARMTAAACRKAGLDCHLVLEVGVHPETQGNLLLDGLLGAKVRLIETDDHAVTLAGMQELAEELRFRGCKPYVIPRGGSVPAGAVGYTAFVPELLDQLVTRSTAASHLYLGTGSTGTHSGILAGLAAVDEWLLVQGISVSRTREEQVEKIRSLSSRVLEWLGLSARVDEDRILVDESYRGPGYGYPTPATMEAIEIAALDEGLILDPVYTGKAMAGLIDHARQGRLTSADTVVFLHTGGTPGLFAYHRELDEALQAVAG